MPDIIDANGLQVMTATEIQAELTSGLQGIYGADINLDSNSPDGEMVGLLTQMATDIRELAVAVNNGFDPDLAQGVILDQRVTFNNIARAGGTYTIQPIAITVNQTVTLSGLDGQAANPNGTGYTVQDGSGNQFILLNTVTLTAGTTSVNFRAQQIGAVSVPTSTITNPVTIVIGVTGINNAVGPVTVGETQETDPQLRTRREQSVALASFGYLNGLQGKIQALAGVTECKIFENRGNTTDGNGIPAHSIWVVVAGGASTDIATTIMNTLNPGPDMKGSIAVTIPTPDGTSFVARYDEPVAEPLYIEFNIQTTVPGFSFDLSAIKTYIVNNLAYGINQYAETSKITAVAVAAIAAQGGGGVPTEVQISSDGISYGDYLTTATLASEWTIDVSRIAITVLT